MTPVLEVLAALTAWAARIGPDVVALVELFLSELQQERPDLIEPGTAAAPPPPPGERDTIDAEIDDMIERGEL